MYRYYAAITQEATLCVIPHPYDRPSSLCLRFDVKLFWRQYFDANGWCQESSGV